jgi:septal ring factor EnvC (AmiA/AmiB activator)
MSELESALRRLDGAVARLEATVGERGMPAPAELAELGAERDRLAEEVRRLHARAADDARLRDEAARAVRSALHDLRGAVGQGNGQGDGHSSAQGDG